MLSSLLTTAAIAAVGLLPVPLPTLPIAPVPTPTPDQAAPAQAAEVSGVLQAADGRLKRGCKDYAYSYSVAVPTEDWTFDITMQDRNGKGVNAQSLIGPNDPESGVLPFRLCRWATTPGIFTLKGVLVSYDGYTEETTVTVTETFRLRRRNP